MPVHSYSNINHLLEAYTQTHTRWNNISFPLMLRLLNDEWMHFHVHRLETFDNIYPRKFGIDTVYLSSLSTNFLSFSFGLSLRLSLSFCVFGSRCSFCSFRNYYIVDFPIKWTTKPQLHLKKNQQRSLDEMSLFTLLSINWSVKYLRRIIFHLCIDLNRSPTSNFTINGEA